MNQSKIVSSFIWKFLERMSAQIINLVVQIILARLIAPNEFGILAILVVFINISTIFVQKGLSSSLIRKKNIQEQDYNTAFIVGFIMATMIYIVLFFLAPIIAEIYELKELEIGLRLISISLFFGSLYCVQNAVLVREMKFKSIFYRGLISSSVSGMIGIIMALQGRGFLALVTQTVCNQFLLCITVWNQIEWKPRLKFSRRCFHEIMSFGGKILLSEILSYSVESMRTLFIGAFYSSESLSYYDRGQSYPAIFMRGIYETIGGVLLPVFSREQNNFTMLSNSFKKILSLLMFLVIPLFAGFASSSYTIIEILLTAKWLPSVPFVIIFCFAQLTQPIQGVCRQMIYACERSDVILKIEIVKDVISLLALLIAIKINVYAIAISFLISMYVAALLMLITVKQIIPLNSKELFKCISKSGVYAFFMFIAVFLINFCEINLFLRLIIQLFIGFVIYVGLALIAKDDNLRYVIKILKNIKKHRMERLK